ncbi:hypothetical protein [Mycobacterium parmense]|uniref:Uncharacterized protein n=1 Tax=Mycobacterium parmense TaxID=185642 RepID=A0A7I7YY81_9MYCO|nr:hypothetical protein [Mycobacterium parmense]MCV7352693.1 hypothetical protein [Mycobacterium parmense]ORW54611.1 hypothetical protein AWC20_19115 [Mycobacterium parmense]BBZ46700.1 hypothetical protein MPRM_39810 [Mycobacterium parmense]
MGNATTTIGAEQRSRRAETVAFWILAGLIMVIAFGEALAVLVATSAVVAAVAWLYRKVERRLERSDTQMAGVSHLPVLSMPGHASGSSPLRGHHAA